MRLASFRWGQQRRYRPCYSWQLPPAPWREAPTYRTTNDRNRDAGRLQKFALIISQHLVDKWTYIRIDSVKFFSSKK